MTYRIPKRPAMPANFHELPAFPPPAKERPPLAAMYAKDAVSPWHKEWDGKTSAAERARIDDAFKEAIAAKKARGEAQ